MCNSKLGVDMLLHGFYNQCLLAHFVTLVTVTTIR